MSLYPDWMDDDIIMIEPEDEETQEGYGYKYDYKNNRVITTTDGKTIRTDEHNSYLYWVYKVLMTERFACVAYSNDYGVEIEAIIESDYSKPVAESEIARSITEALEIDERTKKVYDFSFKWEADKINIHFHLESIYNTDTISVQRGGLT